MWRLKYSSPLRGNGRFLWLVLLLACSLTAMLPGLSPEAAVGTFGGLFLLGTGVLLYITYRLTPDECERIAKADLPLWEPLPELELDAIRSEKRLSLSAYIILTGALVLLGAAGVSLMQDAPVGRWLWLLAFGGGAVMLTVKFLQKACWAGIDESAGAVILAVDASFTRRSLERSRSGGMFAARSGCVVREDRWLVLYLPDGKYVLYSPHDEDPPFVRIIRYRGHCRWAPWYPEDMRPQDPFSHIPSAVYSEVLAPPPKKDPRKDLFAREPYKPPHRWRR